jgi:hypothetical protein
MNDANAMSSLTGSRIRIQPITKRTRLCMCSCQWRHYCGIHEPRSGA